MPDDIHTRRFVPPHRALRPEGLHHSRGVAGSGLRPFPNIPHCCLPEESGPCLSASVAEHPLRPATRLSLCEPLPHQLADGTRAALSVIASLRGHLSWQDPKTSPTNAVLAI